jgi:hypothetical protein
LGAGFAAGLGGETLGAAASNGNLELVLLELVGLDEAGALGAAELEEERWEEDEESLLTPALVLDGREPPDVGAALPLPEETSAGLAALEPRETVANGRAAGVEDAEGPGGCLLLTAATGGLVAAEGTAGFGVD